MARQGRDKRNEIILGFRVPTTCETGGETGGETGSKTGSETGGETGSKTGGKTGSETGSETGQDEFMLGFRVPTTCGKKKFD